MRILVVGNRGLVGARLQEELECEGMDEEDFNTSLLLEADVVISCTGQTGLIKPEMVKSGVTAIDVGYPGGDFDPSTALKAGNNGPTEQLLNRSPAPAQRKPYEARCLVHLE